MQPTTISIDNVQYVRKDSIQETNGDIKIVVLDRGFVYIGRVKIEDDFVVISSAKNIRVWGTTKGLGEIALGGPTSSTKLDVTGVVRAPLRALIALVEVDQEKWNSI